MVTQHATWPGILVNLNFLHLRFWQQKHVESSKKFKIWKNKISVGGSNSALKRACCSNTKLTCIKRLVMYQGKKKHKWMAYLASVQFENSQPHEEEINIMGKIGLSTIDVYTSMSDWYIYIYIGKHSFQYSKRWVTESLQLTLTIQHNLNAPLEPLLHNYTTTR